MLAAGVAACGGDSGSNIECGPGTREEDGTCVADPVPPMCTDGTILDPATNSCVIDPAACQGGTVLVGNQCVEPELTGQDITEAAEPNGLGLFGEDSGSTPAGEITLKAVGEQFVIKGNIAPFQDTDGDGHDDPDIDSYLLTVNAPTLLSVSADGLNGLAAGFIALAAVDDTDPLFDWQRFGINLSGDASKRQMYLPAAGTYLIGIADTRSLFLDGGAAGPEAGGKPFDYWVTVDQLAAPTPTPITLTSGAGTVMDMLAPGETKFYSAPAGLGINEANLEVPDAQALGSLVVMRTTGASSTVGALTDEGTATSALGYRTGDTVTLVVDPTYNYALQPVDFQLDVLAGDAAALSTNGMTATQPESDTQISVFFYDVDAANQIKGMDLTWDQPVTGAIVNENFELFSFFTFDPSDGFATEFTGYTGLLRHPAPGRYYFVVFDLDPADDSDTSITATSTIGTIAPTAIVKGTPLVNQTVNTTFESNAFTYDAGTAVDPWQQFNATGTGTGALTVAYYDPANTYGRLDTLTVTGGTAFPDTAPVFTTEHPSGGAVEGRILLEDPTTTYLVTVNTATPAGTFALDFERREGFVDLMTIAAGANVMRADEMLQGTNDVRRYLLRTNAANGVTITADPDAVTLNTEITQVDIDESTLDSSDNGAAGAADTLSLNQGSSGWTAFTVTPVGVVATAQTFDLTVAVTLPPYTIANGNTAYADACAGGGTMQTLTATGSDPAGDEGLTAAIATPMGFDYFDTAAPQLRVSSNGFLSFNTAIASASFSNANMPSASAPNSVVAPYWDDLENIVVCTKTVGTTLVVQWVGQTFSGDSPVAFQAILDGSDDSIEFVWGGAHVPTGGAATVGIENQDGTVAHLIGFNQANAITVGTSRIFTAN